MPEESPLPIWAVMDAINSGQSASASLKSFRSAGGEVRTQSWYRLFGEAQAALAGRESEAGAPLNRIPTAEETTTWTTKGASGFLHQVEVFVRDRTTGEVRAQPWSVTGDRLISRGNAVSQALDAFAAGIEEGGYEEQILGAVHVGAYELVPEE